MKQRLLVVSAALLLAGTAAVAEVHPRHYPTYPAPVLSELVQDGETAQYLYNVKAQSFFRGANNWMTRATLDDTLGYKFKINVEDQNLAGDTTFVSLNDSVLKFNQWRKVFADGTTGIWVDNNGGANCNSWVITPETGSKVLFNISNAAYPGTVLGGFRGDVGTVGVNGATSVGIYLNLVKADSAELCSTWAAVSVEDYETFIAENKETIRILAAQYNKAAELKAKIEEVEEGGYDASKYYETYADENKTVAELEQAIADLSADYLEFVNNKASQATLDNPVEITAQIANVDGSSITNWTQAFTGEGSTGSHKCNTWSTEGASDGTGMLTPFIENWASKGNILSDQIVKHDTVKVAPGAYRITAKVRCYNESGAETVTGASLFANLNEASLNVQEGTYSTYNSMLCYWKEDFEVYAVVSADSCLTFGMKLQNANFNWLAHKNYRIYALGQSDEALKKAATASSSVKKYSEEDYITASLRDEWNACVDKYLNGETAAEIMQAQLDINALKDTISKNVAAWNAFLAEVTTAKKVAGNQSVGGEDVQALADYVDLELEDILNEKSLTTEEVTAEQAKLKELREAAVQNGLAPGTDFSDYLTNTDFSKGTTGWTFNKISGSTCTANASAKCAEGWRANFDIYQIVKGAPVGVYKITVQGFYRKGRGEAAWKLYFDEYGEKLENAPTPTAYVYMNDNKTPLSYVFDYQTPVGEVYTSGNKYTDPNNEYWYPDDMTSAGLAFDQGAYQMSAFGLVAQKGDSLRVGMKGELADGDNWAIFTRCKLTYEGFEASIIQPELQKAIDGLDLTAAMGKDIKAKAADIKDKAAAVDQTDGQAMFNVLASIFSLNTSISESVAIFADLKSKNDAFFIATSTSQASDATKTEAAELYSAIDDAINNGTYTDADAQDAITKIAEMTVKLAIPAGVDTASDENPLDMTGLIQTPGFDKDGVNSIEGWTGASSGNFGNNDTQKAALALEFYEKTYDMYQDIVGMPNGLYKVKVNAFYRYGSTNDDYTHYVAGEDGLAYLYAIANDTVKAHIKHLASHEEACDDQQGIGTETTFTATALGGSIKYVPNDMQSSRNYFDNGKYENAVYVKVTDGKLRIGVKQEKSVTAGWMIMDEWTLTYYGENSAKEEGVGLAAIEDNAPVAAVEMFDVNGRAVNAIHQGITLVRTTSANGIVTVRKVIVK